MEFARIDRNKSPLSGQVDGQINDHISEHIPLRQYDFVIRDLLFFQQVLFSVLAAEEQHLPRVMPVQPLQEGSQPLPVIEGEAVVKEKRHGLPGPKELNHGHAERKIQLLQGAAG